MRPKLIRRRRHFPRNRICLSDTPRCRAFIGPRLDSSTNYFREINVKPARARGSCARRSTENSPRAKRETDTFDDYLVKRGETYSMRGECRRIHLRLATLSRFALWMHLCNCWDRESDAYLRRKSISFSACSFLCPGVRYFFRQNATILVLFSPLFPRSFFLLCAVHILRKSFLKGGIYLFVRAALLPLLSFSI